MEHPKDPGTSLLSFLLALVGMLSKFWLKYLYQEALELDTVSY